MKIGKLDRQQKLFDLYKVLGTMCRIMTVNGDIVLDDELKATVFSAIEPVLKKRISRGELLPVFEGDSAMQIDAFPDAGDPVEDNAPDAPAVGVGETPLVTCVSCNNVVGSEGDQCPQCIAGSVPAVMRANLGKSEPIVGSTVSDQSTAQSTPSVLGTDAVSTGSKRRKEKYVDGFEKP